MIPKRLEGEDLAASERFASILIAFSYRRSALAFFGRSLTDLLGLSESRLLSARDFARTIGTGGIEIVESDSIHRTCATVVNRQASGKLRSQTYSKFS